MTSDFLGQATPDRTAGTVDQHSRPDHAADGPAPDHAAVRAPAHAADSAVVACQRADGKLCQCPALTGPPSLELPTDAHPGQSFRDQCW